MALQEELEKQGNWLFRHRSSLPLIILVLGTILYLRTEIYPETFILEGTQYEDYFEFMCLAVSLFGLGIRVYTVGHTPRNTSGRNTAEGQVAEVLNTTGIYSVVRHPLYLGNFFMWLGPAMMTGNFWFIIAFCFFYWIYYERIMFAEEQFLRRKFESTYTNWAERVPAFIPNFKNFVKPGHTFSWKKVLKKEKNGLLATFLIFCFFNVSGELVEREYYFRFYLLCGCVFSILLYGVAKFLKTQTRFLDETGR